MRYDIFCFIAGNQSTFPIKIDKTGRVGHLKPAIKAEKAALKDIDASLLKLYQVEVDESCNKTQRINELKQLSQRLGECASQSFREFSEEALLRGCNTLSLCRFPKVSLWQR